MQIKRIFINQKINNSNIIIIKEKNIINRLKNVLRLKPNDSVIVFDNEKNEFLTKIRFINNYRCELKIIEKLSNQKNLEFKINLFQAIIKKDKFEWVVEKGTEAGISSFFPIITERTIKKSLNLDRLNKIAIEAAEQCKRIDVPKIYKITSFQDSIKMANKELSIILDPKGKKIKEYLNEIKKHKEINIFCGPEGGWSKKELSLAEKNNFKVIRVEPFIFKSETIAPLVPAIIFNS
jgi:16S rRNA (uracil1498-N3)-methyltransferase